MQANTIGAINNARISDPATAATVATTAVQNAIIATATGNAAGTHAPAGASTVAAALTDSTRKHRNGTNTVPPELFTPRGVQYVE